MTAVGKVYPPEGDWNAHETPTSRGLKGFVLWIWVFIILPALFVVPVVWLAWVMLGPIVVKVLGG
jgi:hypothetical protein